MADRHHAPGPTNTCVSPRYDRTLLGIPPHGAQHDEEAVAVLLELRPLVGLMRVLDRQLVQAELALDRRHLVVRGIDQADPDEVTFPLRPLADLVERHVGHLAAGSVGGGVDDHAALADRGLSRRTRSGRR